MDNSHDLNVALIEPLGGYGGMQYYDLGLAIGLSKVVNSVHLFSSHIPLKDEQPNIKIYNFFDHVWNKENNALRLVCHIFYYIKGMLIASKNKCDIAHIHQFHFSPLFALNVLLTRLFFKRVVLTVHDIESFSGKPKNSSTERFIYSLIRVFIVHNKYSFEKLKLKVPENVISIIHHGNYIPFVDKVEPKSEQEDVFKILFFGQIKKVKGLDVLLKAVGILHESKKKFQLHIAGKVWKDDLTYYQNIIQTGKVQAHVKMDLRYIPDSELFNLFNMADLIVLPYKEIYQSGVLLKAMSFGRAVLCSDLIPFQDIIIDNKNGFLFKSEDHQSLAAKLTYIIENKPLLKSVGNDGYNYVLENHDWIKIGSNTKKLYENLLN